MLKWQKASGMRSWIWGCRAFAMVSFKWPTVLLASFGLWSPGSAVCRAFGINVSTSQSKATGKKNMSHVLRIRTERCEVQSGWFWWCWSFSQSKVELGNLSEVVDIEDVPRCTRRERVQVKCSDYSKVVDCGSWKSCRAKSFNSFCFCFFSDVPMVVKFGEWPE